MKTFEYRGYDAAGQPHKGLIEALDPKQAREKLAGQGILTERIGPAGADASRNWLSRRRGPTLNQRAEFYHELVALLRAGLPVVNALDVLIQMPEMSATQPRLANLRDHIKEGAPLAGALAGAFGTISPFEKSVIAAGERAAVLDIVLERLAVFLEHQHQLRERIVTALIYPAIIIVVALAIAIGLLGVAVPRIARLLSEQSHVTLPWLTRVVMGTGHFLAIWGLPIIAVIVIAIILAWHRVTHNPETARNLNQRWFRLPLIGRGYTLLVNLRFARTLALLLQGGVPLVDSLPLAGAATGSSWVSRQIERETEAVRHGASLAESLRRIPPFAGVLAGWIQVGETSGTLAQLLESAGSRGQQQWDRYLARCLAWLEPVLIVLIGGFVLVVVLSILLPIISLNQALK